MNIFAEVKTQIDLPNAAEHYGVQVNRGSFANCLFHEDRTPSMKLYDKHFHCYGCGKHGDIITLTGQLFNISPYEAAQKLAQDFHIMPNKNLVLTDKFKPTWHSYIEQENRAFRILNEYCRFLEDCRELYKPGSPSDELHPLFMESLINYEQYNYYRDIFIAGSKEERVQSIHDCKEELNLIEQKIYGGKLHERTAYPSIESAAG